MKGGLRGEGFDRGEFSDGGELTHAGESADGSTWRSRRRAGRSVGRHVNLSDVVSRFCEMAEAIRSPYLPRHFSRSLASSWALALPSLQEVAEAIPYSTASRRRHTEHERGN